jgi:hypothetical protein
MSSDVLRPMVDERQPERPIDPGVRIGHVHLKVADLDRALAFYCGVLGFALMQRYGTQAAFLAAGGYHHHIGLNTWESLGGAWAARLPLRAARDCFTQPFSTRPARRWPMRCDGSARWAFRSMVLPTTV